MGLDQISFVDCTFPLKCCPTSVYLPHKPPVSKLSSVPSLLPLPPLCSFPSLPIWMQSQFVAISRWFLHAFSASQKSLSHLCMMKFTRLLQFWFPITSVTFCGVHPTQCSCSFCTFMPVILNKCIAMFLFIFLHWGGDCFQFTIYCLHYHLLLNDISNGDKCICFALLVSPKRLGSVKLVSYIFLFIWLGIWHWFVKLMSGPVAVNTMEITRLVLLSVN